MTVVVTRNVSDRIRGFLASSMLEIAPGVYTASRLNAAVRDRIWTAISDWFLYGVNESIIMLWDDPTAIGGQGLRVLGLPPVELVDLDGLIVCHR